MAHGARLSRLARFLERRYWLILLSILVGGLGLRVATYHGLSESDPGFMTLGLDSRYFVDWAGEIASGDVLSRRGVETPRAFFMNPLYAYFVAPVVLLCDDVLLAVRVVQMVLGLLTVLLIADLTRRFIGPKTALLSGMVAAAYPLLLYYEQKVMILTLAVFLNATALWCLSRLLTRPTLRAALVAGVPLGLSILARPNVAAFAVLLPLWFWELAPAGRRLRFVVSRTLMLLVGVVAAVSPIALRNTLVAKDFVPVTWSMGVNLWQSNNPEGWKSGWMYSLEMRSNPYLMERDAIRVARWGIARREIARRASGRDLEPDELDAFWRDLARTEMARDGIGRHAIAWREIAGRDLGGRPRPEEVSAHRLAAGRRLLAMREIAKRRVAVREAGRDLTAAEVEAAWAKRVIRPEDIPRVWRENAPPTAGEEIDPEEVERFWADRRPKPSELYEVLLPAVEEYWRGRPARGPLDEYWRERQPDPTEVADYWGERTLSKAEIRIVEQRKIEVYWDGGEPRGSEASRYWSRRTLALMKRRPGEALGFLVRKALYFFRGFEMPSSYYFELERGVARPIRWIPLSFGLLSPLMILGGILVGIGSRRRVPLLFLVLAYAVGLTIFYPLSHYRAPMLPAAIPLAALGATWIVRTAVLGTRRARGLLAMGLVACVLVTTATELARVLGFSRFAGGLDDRVMFFHNRGKFLLGEGRIEEAADAYEEALRADRQAKWGWMGLARVAERRRLWATETYRLERALEVSHPDPMPEEAARLLFERWNGLRRAGRPEAAEDTLWEAIRARPASVIPRLWLVQASVDRMVREELREHLRKAVDLRPESLDLWARLGRNWSNRREGWEAAGLFLARIAAERTDRDAHVAATFADLLLARERYEEALAGYRQVESLAPPPIDPVIATQSFCLRMLDRAEEARETVERGLRRYPESIPLLLERAVLTLGTGAEDREAIREVVEAARRSGAEVPVELERFLED